MLLTDTLDQCVHTRALAHAITHTYTLGFISESVQQRPKKYFVHLEHTFFFFQALQLPFGTPESAHSWSSW